MKKKSKKPRRKIETYDNNDASNFINPRKPLRFEDLGLRLPNTPPTQVISIRLPTSLLNEVKAICSERDVPYQAWIKWCMAEAVKKEKAA
jgi:hypothetical protein